MNNAKWQFTQLLGQDTGVTIWWPDFFWPEWPHFFWPDFERSSQPYVFVLVMASNIFYTVTEASACFIQLLFIAHFFFDPFQSIHRSVKQTHFPVIVFQCVAEKKQTTTLGLASHSRNDKGLWPVIISPVRGKTPHFALCCIMCPLDRDVTYPQVRVTVTLKIDLMAQVLFVTNKPLIELICVKNDGVGLKLYQLIRSTDRPTLAIKTK